MRTSSATVMVLFSKVPFRNIDLLDHSYVTLFSQQLQGTLTAAF